MDKNSLIQYYIQQELERQQNQNSGDNSLAKIKQLTNKTNNLGSNLSTVGNYLKDNVNNELAQKFGSSMANLGGNLSNGATAVSDTLNAPSNYFKGYANRAVGQGLSKIGSSLAGNSGVVGKIGQSLGNLGTSMAGTTAAGTGAAAGAGAGTAATAGTTAATAAGAGGAAAGGAAGGAAAGGAAAGGSAAGGAAAAGPIGALVALGIMAIQGTNRKRAKQGATQLLSATDEMAKNRQKNNLDISKQNAAALQEDAQQNLLSGLGGTMTGGAAPIQESNPISEYQDYLRSQGYGDDIINGIPQGLNGGNKEISDWINQYNSGVGRDNPIKIPQTEEEIAAAKAGSFNTSTPTQTGNIETTEKVKRGLMDKFLSGLTDLSRGYEENRNTAFNPANLKQDKFVDTVAGQSQALTDYQNQLRNNGIDENVVNAVALGKNSGNKDIADWISANQEALKPVDNTVYTDKSKMARIGELLGTTARTFNKPGVQGLIAGGLSAALTGNPLYGLGMAQKFANARANSNIYQDVLANYGVNVNPGMFGTLDNKDMSALMMPKYKEQENELKKIYYDALAEYRSRMATNAENKTEIDKKYKESKAVTDAIKADAAKTRANNAGKGGTKTGGTKKPQDHPDWNNDLAGYYQILTNPRLVSKADTAKARFVQKYGVDPMKYIKL